MDLINTLGAAGEAEAEAVAAWYDFLSEVESVKKDSEADAGKYTYTYTSLPALFRYVKPLAYKHGFVLSHDFQEGFNGHPSVRVEFLRRNGVKIRSGWMTMAAPADPQKQGAAISFGKRYSLQAFLGMVTEDDDAKMASGQPTNIDPPEVISITEWMRERSPEDQRAYGQALQQRFQRKLREIPVEQLPEVLEFTREWLNERDKPAEPPENAEIFARLGSAYDGMDVKERELFRKLVFEHLAVPLESIARQDGDKIVEALKLADTVAGLGALGVRLPDTKETS